MQDLQRSVNELKTSDKLDAVTGVRLTKDGKTLFQSGNMSGRVLEVENPLGSQAMADGMLKEVQGYQHQGFQANGAIADPATELGDTITVDGVTGRVDNMDTTFGQTMTADIGSPGDEEVDHEIPARPTKERQEQRRFTSAERGIAANGAYIDKAGGILQLLTGIDEVKNWDPETGAAVAETALYATIIDSKTGQVKTARISGAVVRDENGNTKSLAQILADEITLQGKINLIGLVNINGRAHVTNNMYVDNTLEASIGNFVDLATDGLEVNGRTYKAKSITSTTGSVTVLGS